MSTQIPLVQQLIPHLKGWRTEQVKDGKWDHDVAIVAHHKQERLAW